MGWTETLRFRDCPWCGVRDAQMNTYAQEINSKAASGALLYWALLFCPRCAKPIIIRHSGGNSSDTSAVEVIPDVLGVTDVQHLPEDVGGYYHDAKRVMDAGVPDAAAVQLRRTLEAAARHNGISQGPLVARIKGLIEGGKITTDFGAVLHHVRKVGNLGAHDTDERLDEPTVRRAFRFTTQVLRNLFEIPAELRELEAEAPVSPSGDNREEEA